jgi:hypothetical protein
MKFIIQLFGQYIMKKILYFMFILMLLISCQLRTSKTTITTDNYEKDSKANVTFSGEVNNGICINCSQ